MSYYVVLCDIDTTRLHGCDWLVRPISFQPKRPSHTSFENSLRETRDVLQACPKDSSTCREAWCPEEQHGDVLSIMPKHHHPH
jgi:hypothetical protein